MADDIVGFLVGRHTGLLAYAPFSYLCVLLFLIYEWRSPERWWTLVGLLVVASFFMVFVVHNWHGGGGFVGNRYFVNVYPTFLFLVTRIRPRWVLFVGWAVAAVLIGPLPLTTWAPVVPAPTYQAHVRDFPIRYLPREISYVRNWIPGYRGVGHVRVWFEGRWDVFRPEGDEMWFHGATEVECTLLAPRPLERVKFRVRSLVPNTVQIRLGDDKTTLSFTDDSGNPQWAELDAGEPWQFREEVHGDIYFYRMWVRSATGAMPAWHGIRGPYFYLGAMLLYMGDQTDRDVDLYAHEIDFARPPPSYLVAGDFVRLPVTVTNHSAHSWIAQGGVAVHLAYHWLDSDGQMVVREGRRTRLPIDLPPGQSMTLGLEVEVPREPGAYQLELAPVFEHVAWFADHTTTPPVRAPVLVVPGDDLGSPGYVER